MNRGGAAVAIFAGDAAICRLVEATARRLSASIVVIGEQETIPPGVGAVLCTVPSSVWESCVARLLTGGPAVPHVLLFRAPASDIVPSLLSSPPRVREAVAGVVGRSAHADAELVRVLAPLLASDIGAGRIARIENLVASNDPTLRRLARTVLEDPRHHTTLDRVIRDSGVARKRALRCIREAGFKPPSHFLRAVRTLGAHALLRSDSTVQHAARAMGYGSADTLRSHFARVFAMTPSSARRLPAAALGGHLRKTGT